MVVLIVAIRYVLPDNSNLHSLGSAASLVGLFVCHDY